MPTKGIEMEAPKPGKYVVCDEHTLGYRIAGGDTLGVLHSSILKGAPFELHPGVKFLSQFSKVRAATLQDWETFRVHVPPDFTEGK